MAACFLRLAHAVRCEGRICGQARGEGVRGRVFPCGGVEGPGQAVAVAEDVDFGNGHVDGVVFLQMLLMHCGRRLIGYDARGLLKNRDLWEVQPIYVWVKYGSPAARNHAEVALSLKFGECQPRHQ